MSAWTKCLRPIAFGVAAAAAVLVGARLILTPIQGDVLVLASAQQPDQLARSSLELHSSSGWTTLGSFPRVPVPEAPRTVTLVEARAPVGSYDTLRLGNLEFPVRVSVQQNVLAPVLIGVTNGRPAKGSIYTGSDSVSLGLNELSGQMKAVPAFRLIDQFGRLFDNSSIAGHGVILAAFHTTCQETCPLYTGLFLQLQKQLPPSVLLIEATNDPWRDTPDVLRAYAGRIGASWTFLTGDPAALAGFWKPFDVELTSSDVHRSTLALIDSHGYIRSYYLGAPDVGASLPAVLADQLDPQGQALLKSHGAGWGTAQVLDTLGAIGGLSSPSSIEEGQAPSFILSTLDGKQVSLSDLRGRPVLINFWATYCVPCRVEMPLIQRMADQHPKLVVLLVDERDSTSAARTFISDLRIRSTVLLDTDGKAGDLYRITGLPTTIFVRADGTIEGRYIGQTNDQILGPHIAAIGA
jgi:cytochrome c biogenesis protein CcmG/thiol:disulfide interchange protein DsbE